MVVIHGQEMARVLRRRTVGGVDVFERAGTRFTQRLHIRRRGKIVANVRARRRAREMRPGSARHRFRPARPARLGRAIDCEGVVAVEAEAAVLDDGFRRAVGATTDAVAQTNNLVVEHEPRLARAQSAAIRVQVHRRHAVEALNRSAPNLVIGGTAIGITRAIRPGISFDGGAGHPVSIHGGPIVVSVVAEVAIVQISHAVGREPAVQIFAAGRFVIGHAIGRHGQTQGPIRLPMNHPIHAGERLVARRLHERHHVGVIHHQAAPYVVRRNFFAHEIAAGVRLHHALDEGFVSGRVGGRGELGDAQNRAEQIMPGDMVITGARVVAPSDHRQQPASEEKRLVGLLDPSE